MFSARRTALPAGHAGGLLLRARRTALPAGSAGGLLLRADFIPI
jgi:hypothetical protein